jgi:hypothetical protein
MNRRAFLASLPVAVVAAKASALPASEPEIDWSGIGPVKVRSLDWVKARYPSVRDVPMRRRMGKRRKHKRRKARA